MFRSRKWAAGLAFAVSLIAIAGITFLISGPAQGEPAAQSTPEVQQQHVPPATPASTPEQRGIAESVLGISNGSPEDLLAGTLQARARRDAAWLARTLASTAGKSMLTELDAHAANRQFLTRNTIPMWQLVDAAWQAQNYRIDQDGQDAVIVLQSGGNLGEIKLVLVRIGEVWFYAGT